MTKTFKTLLGFEKSFKEPLPPVKVGQIKKILTKDIDGQELKDVIINKITQGYVLTEDADKNIYLLVKKDDEVKINKTAALFAKYVHKLVKHGIDLTELDNKLLNGEDVKQAVKESKPSAKNELKQEVKEDFIALADWKEAFKARREAIKAEGAKTAE